MVQVKDKESSLERQSGIGTFATLVNNKIVVPSSTSNYYAIEKFFLFNMLAPMIDRIDVDDRWYIARNPDVRDAMSRGVVNDVRDHYRRHGYFEGRMPYKIEVDAAWYESTYPDVRDAIRRQDFESAQGHFEMLGYTEGRLPFPGFSLKMRDE